MKRLIFAAMGGHALVAQVVLLRETLVVLSGHEIGLGMVLASWLLGIFGGAWLGSEMQAKAHRPRETFAGLQAATVLLTVALVVAIRHLRIWVPTPSGTALPLLPSLLATLSLVAPQGVMVGALFPLASALAARDRLPAARIVGAVYGWEAVGSMLCGLALTWVLLPRLDALSVLSVTGIPVLLLNAVWAGRTRRTVSVGLTIIAAGWGLALWGGGIRALQTWSVQARWDALHPGVERLVSADSPYQCVEIGRLDEQYSVFGNGRLLATFPDPLTAAATAHITMNQSPRPREVLVLGGGPGSLVPLLLQYSVERIQLVELDPLIFSLASPYLQGDERQAMEDSRVGVSFTDGRHFVRGLPPSSLDAVIVQMPDPSTALLNRFHTVEFFEEIRRALRPSGVLAHVVSGAVNYVGPDVQSYVGMIRRSLAHAFREVRLVPGDRMLFLACDAPEGITLEPGELASRSREPSGPSLPVPSELFSLWIEPQQIRLWENALGQEPGPLNRDERPLSYLRFLSMWDLVSGKRFGQSPLRHLRELPFAAVMAMAMLAVLCPVLGRRGVHLQRAPLVAVGVMGFSGMAQEILCLYMYQALRGVLYSMLGLLVALFMAGLALGAWLGARWCPRSARSALGALLGVQGYASLLCVGIPLGWLPLFFEHAPPLSMGWILEGTFGLWLVLVGIGTGASFPLGCAAWGPPHQETGRKAGIVSAWDHSGAALGAFLPGVLLVPVFGLGLTGAFLAAVQGMVALLLGWNLLAFSRKGR
jgi:spermidine synthase